MIGAIIVIAIIVIVLVVLAKFSAQPSEMLCVECENASRITSKARGSFSIELILWLFLIVPGIIYSVWRLAKKVYTCPCCGSNNMIPFNSPKAQKILAK